MTIKVNGAIYSLWAQYMRYFLGSLGKDHHLDTSPITMETSYELLHCSDKAFLPLTKQNGT